MAWFRLEGRGAFHHKVVAAGDEAYGAWVRAGQVASLSACGGRISFEDAIKVARVSVWRKLCKVGLAERESEGYRLIIDGIGVIVLPESWDRSDVPAVRKRDGDACRYCGSGEDLTIDHVIPRVQGGPDRAHNLVVACRVCNSRKNGRTPEQAGMVLLPIGGAP